MTFKRKAKYGYGDDGLRALAPDNWTRKYPNKEKPSRTRSVNLSCVHGDDSETVYLSIDEPEFAIDDPKDSGFGEGGAWMGTAIRLPPSEAIELGRLLVWMAERVKARGSKMILEDVFVDSLTRRLRKVATKRDDPSIRGLLHAEIDDFLDGRGDDDGDS